MKILLWFVGLSLSLTVQASNFIDIYGAEDELSARILKKYDSELNSLLQTYNQTFKLDLDKQALIFEQISKKKFSLIEQIKKDGNFLFADLSLIFYPDLQKYYGTIEVVSRKEPQRLNFLDPESSNLSSKSDSPNTIFDKMHEYIDLGSNLILNGQMDYKISCPVYHCLFGFDHPKLKPYLTLFNEAAKQQKQEIIQALSNPDPSKRSAAAYLMGHFENPKEILSNLEPHVKDKNSEVRNDVVRVIATTLSKSNKTDISILPFLELLASPYTSDRNKALVVLSMLVKNPDYKDLILQKAATPLLNLLKLQQPNNHDFAYIILKELSGKNFSERDYKAWGNWLMMAKSND